MGATDTPSAFRFTVAQFSRMGEAGIFADEVSDTTLRYDRAMKLPLYARHGIPEVWIVDLESSTLKFIAMLREIFTPRAGRSPATKPLRRSPSPP